MNDDSVNILMLGGAKRVSMARKFRHAAQSMGLNCRIYSYEMDLDVPIACEATVIRGLRWSDADVYDHIASVCGHFGINVVIPFVDGAVAVASEYARRYPGVAFAPSCAPHLAEMMFDKVRSNEAFIANGLPVPATCYPGKSTPSFPLIAKPRHGSASKGIVRLDFPQELEAMMPVADDYLFQEFITNRREYTVDCYVGMETGDVLAAIPRVRDAVIGGEVSRTTVVHDPRISELVEKTLKTINLRGAVTVQLIEDLDTDRLMLMEINPRLGGGAVAAVHAGADLPAMILAEALGGQPEPCTAWKNIVVARYLDEVVFDN